MTNLLINEPPLQVLPSLAVKVGLNEAIVVQQIHYWIGISKNVRDGYTWVYKTFDDWQDEFPFWSKRTIERTISVLEKNGILVSASYNKLKFDRTKWYRINYEKFKEASNEVSRQNDGIESVEMTGTIRQDDIMEYTKMTATESDKMTVPITREYTETTTENTSEKEIVDTADFSLVFERIINYLNQLAGTNYKHTTKKTQQLIRARLKEKFTVGDFQQVIEKKVATWSNDSKMVKYLRPETLFGTKFESYLNEKVGEQHGQNNGSNLQGNQKSRPGIFGNYCSD
ncbi:conserved phage C-terminal domain-containing protein [Viridibacillus arvi]|uniref:conserved phage C-terminal domain-containing protein n=1 Tax=Viridibacillus arvi TaxID=263475 RepID=UPI003D2A6DA0